MFTWNRGSVPCKFAIQFSSKQNPRHKFLEKLVRSTEDFPVMFPMACVLSREAQDVTTLSILYLVYEEKSDVFACHI
jgi:hypothetical protein